MYPSRIVITMLLAFALCVGAALQGMPHADESGVSQASTPFLGNGVSTAEAKVHTQENHGASQGKAQEYGTIKPPAEVTEDALRNGMSSSGQSQPEVQNNGAPEETGQRPNVYVPDEDETPDEDEAPDEDEGKNRWIYNLAAVAFLVLFVFFIIKYREAIADFASRKE